MSEHCKECGTIYGEECKCAEEEAAPKKALSSPAVYAVQSFFAVPAAAMVCLICAVFLLSMWVLVPGVCYFQRKEEINKQTRSS